METTKKFFADNNGLFDEICEKYGTLVALDCVGYQVSLEHDMDVEDILTKEELIQHAKSCTDSSSIMHSSGLALLSDIHETRHAQANDGTKSTTSSVQRALDRLSELNIKPPQLVKIWNAIILHVGEGQQVKLVYEHERWYEDMLVQESARTY